MRQGVQARGVRHRSSMQLGVERPQLVDVGQIGMAHELQIAMREHRAFRATGRATGIEQPSKIRWIARHGLHAGRRQHSFIAIRARANQLRRAAFARGSRSGLGYTRRREHGRRTRIRGNVGNFAMVQLGVHRHRDKACCPAGRQHFQIRAAVLHEQDDPVAVGEPACPQSGGEPQAAIGELRVGPGHAAASHCRRMWLPTRDAGDQRGQIHGAPPDRKLVSQFSNF